MLRTTGVFSIGKPDIIRVAKKTQVSSEKENAIQAREINDRKNELEQKSTADIE